MERGVTLIELVVVIVIVGLLAAALLTVLNPLEQIQKSRDARRKTDLAAIQRSLELFYQDTGKYPSSSTGGTAYRIVATDGNTKEWGTAWTPYMGKLPKDPDSAKRYVYYRRDEQTYYLYVSLDRGAKDSQACNGGSACSSLSGGGFPPNTSCGGTCSYGVSSSNTSP